MKFPAWLRLRIVAYIREFRDQKGRSPTTREIWRHILGKGDDRPPKK